MNQLELFTPQLLPTITVFIVILVFLGLNRKVTQRRTGKKLIAELSRRDNTAYGISYAGTTFSFIFVASTIMSTVEFHRFSAALGLLLFSGAFTLIALETGRFIHDKFILPRFNENEEINQNNVAGAIIEASSLFANALVILALYAIFNKTTEHELNIWFFVLTWIIAQLILLIVTRWREFMYSMSNQGSSFQNNLRFKNTAVAIRHGSWLVASAMLFRLIVSLVDYTEGEVVINVINILFFYSAFALPVFLFVFITNKIVLKRINSDSEIDHQDNIGIACAEMAVILAIPSALGHLVQL